MARGVAVSALLLVLHHIICCEGFDFTLDPYFPEPSQVAIGRPVCGMLHCTESLQTGSASQENRSRSLTGFTVSRLRLGTDGTTTGRWQQLVSLTTQKPSLDRVSDGIQASGQLSDHQASLTLKLTKTHDCQESQFSCEVISVDDQGRTSVKKSLVGKAVDSQAFGPRTHAATVQFPSLEARASSDVVGLVSALTQLASSVQTRLDWVESRLEDSLRAVENRLGDRVEEVRAAVKDITAGLDNSVNGRFGALDNRVDTLENRLEDKILQVQRRIVQALEQKTNANSDQTGFCTQLAAKLDDLDSKVDSNTGKLDGCLTEIAGQSSSLNSITGKMSTVTSSMQAIENNLTSLDVDVGRLETSLDQCVDTGGDPRLTGLVSDVASLSDLTQDLASQVGSFRQAYEHGAIVPVDEFSDPLGDGKKEWRLVFRGTAYNNVRVYPAYLHGTGIPLEVEAGCRQFNRSLPCVNHYRNRDAIDNWAGIDEVLFAIYKDGQLVKRVTFNGKGSTFTDWFSQKKILQSSWVDLTTQPHNYFSILGADHTDHVRRFFMSLDYLNGCTNYRGWFKVLDLTGGCPEEGAEAAIAVPIFRYAPATTYSRWVSSATADAFGIFVKYE